MCCIYKNTTFSFFSQVFYYICLRDCEFFHSLPLGTTIKTYFMNKKPLRFEEFKKELAKDKLKAQNLNHFNIPADRYHMRDLGGQEAVPSEDYSTKINSPKFDIVETHFRNI